MIPLRDTVRAREFPGIAAAFAHFRSDPDSPRPSLGARAAISGELAAYLVLVPRLA